MTHSKVNKSRRIVVQCCCITKKCMQGARGNSSLKCSNIVIVMREVRAVRQLIGRRAKPSIELDAKRQARANVPSYRNQSQDQMLKVTIDSAWKNLGIAT